MTRLLPGTGPRALAFAAGQNSKSVVKVGKDARVRLQG